MDRLSSYVDFLNILPIDSSICQRSEIYKTLYMAVKTEFVSKKKLLPNSNRGFSSSDELMLLGSSDLADLLTHKQAKQLFGRTSWIDKKVTTDKTKLLRDYLYHQINIPEHDLTSFANKIDNTFMSEQTDKWTMQFYKVISKAPALWREGAKNSSGGILRSKPIIRIESDGKNNQIIPFQKNSKPNVFLPTKEHSKYAIVKRNIAENKVARKFLENLGLTAPDIFSEINEFILPKLRAGELYADYFDDIKKVLEASKSQNQEKRKQLVQDLKECPFIIGHNPETSQEKLLKYDSLYFKNEYLRIYFGNSHDVYYVADEKKYNLNSKEYNKLTDLLREIGVESTLRRIEFNPNFSWQMKAELRKGKSASMEYHCKDYKLDGLDKFLNEEITFEKSIALWNLLIDYLSSGHHSDFKRKLFKGEYAYKNYKYQSENFDAYFTRHLKENAWIFINNQILLTSEASCFSLPEEYKDNNSNFRILADILGFKPDEIKVIEEKTGGKFIPSGEIEEYEKWKAWKAEQEKPQETRDGFIPNIKSEEAKLNSRELNESITNIKFNPNQGIVKSMDAENRENHYDDNISDQDINREIKKPSQKLLNDIGEWGQKYVLRDLQNEFKADEKMIIVDLNEHGSSGVGADFEITKENEIVRLIEVKSTTGEFGHTLSISGTQWEIARTYFKENNGDKYWIYCVFNAGTENAEIVKIKNPIKKWKDGKLLAHPINFIIK